MGSEVTALSNAYDLTLWVAERVARFPKAHHYTIGARMVTTLLDAQETNASSDEGRQRRLPHQSRKATAEIGGAGLRAGGAGLRACVLIQC